MALTGGNWLAMLSDHDASDARDLLAWRVGWAPRPPPASRRRPSRNPTNDAGRDRVHGGGTWNLPMVYGPEIQSCSTPGDMKVRGPCMPASDVAFLFGPVVRFSGRFAALLDDYANVLSHGKPTSARGEPPAMGGARAREQSWRVLDESKNASWASRWRAACDEVQYGAKAEAAEAEEHDEL